MTSDEFIATIGLDNLSILKDATEVGFNEYFTEYSHVSFKHEPRTRATNIHDHTVDYAKSRLNQSEVRFLRVATRCLFEFKSTVIVNFKKLDEQLKGSNYPTQTAMDFINHRDLKGIPSCLPRVTVGYVPKTDFTEIMGVYAVKYDTNSEVEWELDLISTLDGDADSGNEELYGT